MTLCAVGSRSAHGVGEPGRPWPRRSSPWGCPAPGSAQPEPAPAPEAVRPPEPGPGPDAVLAPLVVEAPPPLSSSSEILIPGKDFELRPQGRPGDILRLIPGFVIGQHHGGGKAEQYFLRGFDGDHGTDIGFFFDGLPVNLRSHAHGQGYTDLHFVIPETLLRVDVYKGPYYPEYGDFSTAGSINFVTLDSVDENLVQAGGGSFGTQRYLTLLSPTRGALKTLFAAEIYYSDGPDVRPQNYRRFNLFAKATASLAEDMTLRFTGTYLRSDWFASGQIPERAVRENIIGRFGSIDDSEGGNTQRLNLNGTFVWKPSENQLVLAQAYASYYTLDLYSNFTFFLRDPENGDGIEQVPLLIRHLAGRARQSWPGRGPAPVPPRPRSSRAWREATGAGPRGRSRQPPAKSLPASGARGRTPMPVRHPRSREARHGRPHRARAIEPGGLGPPRGQVPRAGPSLLGPGGPSSGIWRVPESRAPRPS